jgi:hypothetical protein
MHQNLFDYSTFSFFTYYFPYSLRLNYVDGETGYSVIHYLTILSCEISTVTYLKANISITLNLFYIFNS